MDSIFNKIIECGYGHTRLSPMLNQMMFNVFLLACGIIN